MERPEEPVRHNVAGNGKRDGAKAEKIEEGLYGLTGWQRVQYKRKWFPSVHLCPCAATNKGLFSYECP